MSQNLQARWLSDFILEIVDIAPWAKELIELSTIVDQWKEAGVITPGREHVRTNELTRVSHKLDPRFKTIENKIAMSVSQAFGEYQKRHTHVAVETDTGYDLLKYQKDQFYNTHVDNNLNNLVTIDRQLSVVFFLNSQYNGGELFFPIQNLKLQGRSESVFVFPSNFCYPHASMPILSGTKYSLVTWLSSSSAILTKLGYDIKLEAPPSDDASKVSELV